MCPVLISFGNSLSLPVRSYIHQQSLQYGMSCKVNLAAATISDIVALRYAECYVRDALIYSGGQGY